METGWFYYFLRLPGPLNAGHLGWGCLLPGRYMCGGLENMTDRSLGGAFVSAGGHRVATAVATTTALMAVSPLAAPTIGLAKGLEGRPEGDNDYWSLFAPTEEQMLETMRSVSEPRRLTGQPKLRPYTCYKKVPVEQPNPSAAVQKGMFWAGYSIVGNNCLDNTAKMAAAYGVPAHLSRPWHKLRPRGFFFDVLKDFRHVPL